MALSEAMANVASEDAKVPATFVLCASFQRRQRRYSELQG
jgi:hypothetical protein